MAGIEFEVDAVLGSSLKLEEDLKKLKTNLTLNINNKQALQSVKAVQQQINALKKSMNNLNLNVGGNSGNRNSGRQNNGNSNAVTATIEPETLKATETLYKQISNSVSGTVKQIQVLRNEQGQITSGTVTVADGITTWKRNLEFVNGQYQRVIASGRDMISLTQQQNALNKLGKDTDKTINTDNIKGVSSLKEALNSANLGWDMNNTSIKQFSQQVDNAGHTITKFTTRHKTIENGVEVWKDTSYAVSTADNKLRQYNQTQSQVLNTQQSLTTMLKSAMERFAVWGIAMKVWTGLGNAVQDCTNYIIDLDSAMTNIRVVTMDTKEATQELLETYNQMGQDLGANTLDIAEGAVDWLRQGFNEADTTELVKDSTILSKLALIDNAQATEYLTSALKGYKLEAQDAISVIDQLVAIDLEASTSAGDMAEAMSRTANMARTTGFEMNELLGVIATVSEVTQNSASTVGNSIKTLLSRMSNVKAGVDDFEGESLNDVEKTLNRVGIALRDNQGNWYDFYDIFDEVASRWDSFSDVQQSQITTALGGTRQRENVLVALENWDKVKQYAETGANSAGTAMEKYDIILESVSAKQEQLNAKVQEFYMNLVSSGLLTGLLDFANGLMDIVNFGDSLIGKIALLIAGLTALNFVMKSNSLAGFRTVLTEIGTHLKTVITAIPKLIIGLKAQKTAQDAVNTSTATGNALAMANPWLAIAEIAIMAIMGIKMAIDAHNEAIQESIDNANELTETYKSTSKELNDNLEALNTPSDTDKYKSLQDEFNHLTEGVDAYGNNLSLTNEEYERYKSICEQLVGLNPDLMEGYDSEIEAIGNKNGLLQNTINLLKEEARLKAKEYADSSDDILKGSQNQYDKDLENAISGDIGSKIYQAGRANGTIGLFDGWDSTDAIKNNIDEILADTDKYYNDAIEWMESRNYSQEAIDNFKDGYDEWIEGIKAVQEGHSDDMNDIYKATAQSIDGYSDLDVGTQKFINQFIIDNYKTDDQTTEEVVNANKKAIEDIVNALKGSQEGQNALSDLLKLDPDDINYDEYKDKVEEVVDLIAEITGQDKEKIKITLGFDVDNTEDLEGFDEIAETLSSKFGDSVEEVEDKLGDMSKASIDALLAMDEATLQSCKSWDDLRIALLNATSDAENMDTVFSDYADNIQSLTEQYEILREAQEEYNEYGNLSAKTMQSIIDNGLLEYLSAENGQLTFNTQALQDNANATQNNAIAKLQEALFTDLQSIALGTYQSTLDSTNSDTANAELQAFQTELGNTTNKALETATAISAMNSALGTDYKFSDEQKKQADAVVANYNAVVSKVKSISISLPTNYNNNRNGSGGSSKSGGSKSSKSSKEWWETSLEKLKDDLDYDAITLDTYINGVQNILNKLKKGSDAWKEVNKELQKAKLDRVENQFDRGEITIDQYIQKLTELRKSYKKNTEGYKELTETINDAKYDKFANQYERGEITASQYIKKLQSLQKQYKKGSEEYKKIADEIDEIKLEKTEQYLDKLEDKIDAIDQKINRLGEVNTDKESVKYAQLLSQKYIQVQKNIASIKKQLKDTNLTDEQREALQDKLNDLLVEEVDIRDEIEDQVRTYYENQREQAEEQAELTKKQTLYNKELELYGKKGKELFEWETNKKIKAIEDEIELRQAEKDALDDINEREELENNLLEARLKLQNALDNKTTKILKKQADGTWQYEYSANMADVKSAKEEIEDAEKALADFDWEQGIKALEEEADKLNNTMEDLSEKYDEAEFWAEREYEQTMNGIEKAYGDIDGLVEKWMKNYGGDTKKLTEGYQSLVSANNTLENAITQLQTAIESKYETVGTNKVSTKDGVKSFDTGGKIVGSGLILAHDKERVLTEQQNLYFEQLVSKLPQLLKAVDITKFGGIGSKSFGSRVNADKVNSTVINKVECVFPNINSTDGLQKAILELPRLALQNK